ncbi:MAG: LacI family transcriptional regulator, partial [Bacteroidales bacterium]|nr:LacI family transcriptional regulator [Bacteroidales bacterium]
MKKKDNNKINVTVQDIAKVVNISASTVSRALNNHPKISQKTKEKVWEAARRLGYQPNIPVYLNQEQTRAICFMVPEIDNNYYLDAIESVRKYVQKRKYHLYIAPTNNSVSTEEFYLQSLINIKIEGVIVGLFKTNNKLEHLESLLNYKIPTVFINKNEYNIEATSIIPDIFNGAYKATKHLISMGCKNIHLVVSNIENPLYADLTEGYRTAIDEQKDKLTNEFIHSSISNRAEVEKLLNSLKANNTLPDGIISGNQEINSFISDWFKNNGLKIPEDLLLVSFETGKKEECTKNTVSSILVSGSKIGKLAAESLFEQISKQKIKKETI